jgi:hypothetical protein
VTGKFLNSVPKGKKGTLAEGFLLPAQMVISTKFSTAF